MKHWVEFIAVAVFLTATGGAIADTFGTGANQFDVDFVTISGDASSANGTQIGLYAGPGRLFVDPGDYRMGVYEITIDQWNKFEANLGITVPGAGPEPEAPFPTSSNEPSRCLTWNQAAQFVNWMNTSTGHHAAYNFTGTQGTEDYTFATWSAAEAAGGTNLYRHKDAFYFLPTEDEWVKAGYWNGTALQTYATKPGETLHQGDGVSGTGWNYYLPGTGYALDPYGAWEVGSGSEELNGTYDMMGNAFEWMENPSDDPSYGADSERTIKGGSFICSDPAYLMFDVREGGIHPISDLNFGFRVAAVVPEPATMALLGLGAATLLRRRK